MRASATSRTASANHHVPQTKTDANKAGEASPFALLVESTAPNQAAKPSKKDAQESGDKPADDKPAANQDDKAGAAQAAAQPPAKPPAKSEKSDKDKSEVAAKADDGATDDSRIAASDLQLLNLPALPPQAQAPIVTNPAGISEDMQAGVAAAAGAAAATAAAKPSPDLQIDGAMSAAAAKTAASATAQSPVPAQSDDSQIEEPQTPEAAPVLAAQPDVKTPAPGGDAAKPMKAAAIGKSMGNADGTVPHVDSAKTNSGKSDIARNEAAKSDAANDDIPGIGVPRSDVAKARAGKEKEDVTKGYAIRGGAKGHIAQGDVAKSDTDKADAGKTLPTNPPQVETDNTATAAKPASQPVEAANRLFTIDGVAAPQAPQANQTNAPTITQHVQVSAQVAPNVPALAVEIAAKSQSGAKQFDIRLDPPELGRVEVRLSIDATGKASAHLSADQPQTLHLLQKDAPVLARALRDAGLDVSQDGLNFSLRQQGDGGNANTSGRRGTSRAFSLTATASIDAAATTAAYRGRTSGRLDIRV